MTPHAGKAATGTEAVGSVSGLWEKEGDRHMAAGAQRRTQVAGKMGPARPRPESEEKAAASRGAVRMCRAPSGQGSPQRPAGCMCPAKHAGQTRTQLLPAEVTGIYSRRPCLCSELGVHRGSCLIGMLVGFHN